MKAALYCRLSVEDEHKFLSKQNSESILNQLTLLKDYAKQHHFEIYDYYIDDNYSGLNNKRPAFLHLLSDAKAHYFDVILCKNQSRFTRDLEIVEKYLHGLFPLWNIRFIGVSDHVDTQIRSGKKLRQLNGLFNEWYCEDLSENVRLVLHNKMLHGEFIGSFSCYGYLKNPDNHHQLIIDPIAKKTIQEIFYLYENNYSMAKIAQTLTTKKIPPPAIYKKIQGSHFQSPNINEKGAWSISTIKRILHDETYIGTLVQGKVSKLNCKSSYMQPIPKEKWIRIPNHHPAIISSEQFLHVQKLIQKNRKKNIPL